MELINKNKFLYKNKSELSQKKHQEYKLIGSTKKVAGHILFSYNKATGEIKKAEIVRCNTYHLIDKKPIINDHIKVERNCYYCQALNKKNFIKKLVKIGMFKNYVVQHINK